MQRTTSSVFKALGHPHRLRIVQLLMQQRRACCRAEAVEDCTLDPGACDFSEIAGQLDVTSATVSHHLKELENAGLIERVRSGRRVHCRINAETLARLRSFLTLDGSGDGG